MGDGDSRKNISLALHSSTNIFHPVPCIDILGKAKLAALNIKNVTAESTNINIVSVSRTNTFGGNGLNPGLKAKLKGDETSLLAKRQHRTLQTSASLYFDL